MIYDKTSILIIFLSAIVFTGCSSDRKNNTSDNIKSQADKSVTTAKTNSNPTFTSAPGLTIYVDPITGEYLDAPPEGYVPPEKKSSSSQSQSGLNIGEDTPHVYEEKQSETPGGGTYIKMPSP